jgi:hypothetical protein
MAQVRPLRFGIKTMPQQTTCQEPPLHSGGVRNG